MASALHKNERGEKSQSYRANNAHSLLRLNEKHIQFWDDFYSSNNSFNSLLLLIIKENIHKTAFFFENWRVLVQSLLLSSW